MERAASERERGDGERGGGREGGRERERERPGVICFTT